MLLKIKEKNYKEAYFFIPAIITMIIQITNVVYIIKSDIFIQHSTAAPKSFITILEQVLQGLFWYIQSFLPYALPFLGMLILGIMILKFYHLRKIDKIDNSPDERLNTVLYICSIDQSFWSLHIPIRTAHSLRSHTPNLTSQYHFE